LAKLANNLPILTKIFSFEKIMENFLSFSQKCLMSFVSVWPRYYDDQDKILLSLVLSYIIDSEII